MRFKAERLNHMDNKIKRMSNEHIKWKAILEGEKECFKIIVFAIKIPVRVAHNIKCFFLPFFFILLVISYDLFALSFIFHAQLLLIFFSIFFILYSILCSFYKGKHLLHLIECSYKRISFALHVWIQYMIWHLWKKPNWIKFDSQREKISIYIFKFSHALPKSHHDMYIYCLHLLWFFFVCRKSLCNMFFLPHSFGLWILSLLYHYQTFANPILWHKFELSGCMCSLVLPLPYTYTVSINDVKSTILTFDLRKLNWYDIFRYGTSISSSSSSSRLCTMPNIIVCMDRLN